MAGRKPDPDRTPDKDNELEAGQELKATDPFSDPSLWKAGTKPSQKRSARRDPPRATVDPDDWYDFNSEGTDLMDDAGRARKVEGPIYRVGYVVSLRLGYVGFYPTDRTDSSTALIRRHDRKTSSTIRFHHEGPFVEEPKLRPGSKVQAEMRYVNNPLDGMPMVAIMLGGAKEARTDHREETKEKMAAEKAKKAEARKKRKAAGQGESVS